MNRREFIKAGSLASLGLSAYGVDFDPSNPFKARKPHYIPKAKNVIFIMAAGACSQLETFDYKPVLFKYHGKDLPPGLPAVSFQAPSGKMAEPMYKFRKKGECGKCVSDLLPHTGDIVDDLCFIHSMTSKTNTHGPGENLMSTGYVQDGFPSIGSWVSYALGCETDSLPAYVAIPDPRGVPQASVNNWSSGFLPAVFQGIPFNANKPLRNIKSPTHFTPAQNRDSFEFLQQMNRKHLSKNSLNTQLSARISSYELSLKMQKSIPEVLDFEKEKEHVLNLYGISDRKNKLKASFGRNCLLARRLIEKGVRFVHLFNGSTASGGRLNWDGHKDLKKQYDIHGAIMDQPVAGLIRDLKQRGMFEDTLVVWCTEFGRMPMNQNVGAGRDHNPNGFTCWLAGAGIKAPFSFGETDEFGYSALQPTSVHDLHATVLHLLGINHEKLTHYQNGIDRRLTDVHGHILRDILI